MKRAPVQSLIDQDQIRVVFQPIVDLHAHNIFSFESLARTTSTDYPGPPARFQAAVEQEMCGVLGRRLRELSVAGCPNYPLFLNIHPNEFDENWLVRPDDPIFLHDRDVYLEITESVPLSHFNFCNSILREVRGKGISLAVDDLGAGYSNLKYIADLSPEIVKLDRCLVAGLRRDTRLHVLVTAIVRLCADLGARVVAEGIETKDELSAALDTGVRYGQGYLFARPNDPPPELDREFIRSLTNAEDGAVRSPRSRRNTRRVR
jgi:EAL domain-containing protein (putative c-di-GMP-specific phosphodiesterase class I)